MEIACLIIKKKKNNKPGGEKKKKDLARDTKAVLNQNSAEYKFTALNCLIFLWLSNSVSKDEMVFVLFPNWKLIIYFKPVEIIQNC